jgi:hypothetical protein
VSSRFIYLAAAVVLTAAFYSNSFGAVSDERFTAFQRDEESLVIGRIVKARKDGLYSAGGQLGWVDLYVYEPGFVEHQYERFFQGWPGGVYHAYVSEIGAQAHLFFFLDRAAGLRPEASLRLLHFVAALLAAAGVAALVLWFHREFGTLVAVAVLVAILWCPWLTLAGRNLKWSVWAFFLPTVVVAHLLARDSSSRRLSDAWLGLCVGAAVFLKLLFNGYNFVTTVLAAQLVPLVYYAVRDSWPLFAVIRRTAVVAFASLSAGLVAFSIHLMQLRQTEGSLKAGLQYIAAAFGRSSKGNLDDYIVLSDAQRAVAQRAYEAGVLEVVATHLHQGIFDLNPILGTDLGLLRFAAFELVAVGAICGVAAWLLARSAVGLTPRSRRQLLALSAATVFSILAPISYFVVFKSGAARHFHKDPFVWNLPFTFFVFALVAVVALQSFRALRQR